ncbi:hypothetical protein [Emergencia sp.]|uniref:hypothetical protein n=1 Tax=Emergencia sp. TaxID=1926557 RepID=UPI003AF0A129
MRISKKAKSIMLKTSIALCVFVGILASIPNLVSERAELYWIATIPLGIIAFVCSMSLDADKKGEKTVCFISSIALTLSFPILMFIGSALDALCGG